MLSLNTRNREGAPETDVTCCSSVAQAVSFRNVNMGSGANTPGARAARSNIQAGISSYLPDARPERLQRKTSLTAFSTTS